MPRYKVSQESKVLLDDEVAALADKYAELTKQLTELMKGKRVAVSRSRKAAMELIKFLRQFRKSLGEVKFEELEQ